MLIVVSHAVADLVASLNKQSVPFNTVLQSAKTIIEQCVLDIKAQQDKTEASALMDQLLKWGETTNSFYQEYSTVPQNEAEIEKLRKNCTDALSVLLMKMKDSFNTRCSRCKSIIVGPFYNVDKKIVCTMCFVCKVCKLPLSNYYEKENELYCMEHFAQISSIAPSIYCARCSKVITDTYMQTQGKSWHNKCFNCYLVLSYCSSLMLFLSATNNLVLHCIL